MNKPHKILIVYPSGHLFAAPAVQALIELVSKNNYLADVLLIKNKQSPSEKLNTPNIRFRYFNYIQKQSKEQRIVITISFVFWIYKMIKIAKINFLPMDLYL